MESPQRSRSPSPVNETNPSPPNSPVKMTSASPPTSPTPGTSYQDNVIDPYKDSGVGGGYNNPNVATAIPQYKPAIVVTPSRDYNFETEPHQSERAPLIVKSKPPSRKKQMAFNIFMASALVATIALIITLVVLSSNSAASNSNEVVYNTTARRLLKAVGAPAGNETDSVVPADGNGTNSTSNQNGTVVVPQSTAATATSVRTTPTVSTTSTTLAPTPSTTEPPPDTSIQVEVDQGILQGKRLNSTSGREYLAFLGIPYAAPSNSSNRFQDPKEAVVWEGTRDARSFQVPCIHQENGVISGQEDCLYLNVFTPKNSSELGNSNNNGQGGRGGGGRRRNRNRNNFPVIVYVGEVGSSSGNTRIADYFMNSNVTLVTFEYRSGLFGSLNLNVTGASGNQGFKDQVMAFQWVRDNIAQFGGNRRKITLLGNNGIGSNVVSAHLLSSMSSSLFHRAIISSGTVLQPGFFKNQTKIARLGLQLGQSLNCMASTANSTTSVGPSDNSTAVELNSNDLLNCFLNKSVNELVTSTFSLQQPWSQYLTLSVDSASDGDIFFTDTPVQLLEAGNFKRLPLIIGTSTNSLSQNRKTKRYVNESDFDLADFMLLPSTNSTNQILAEVEQFYFNATNDNGNLTTNSNDTTSTQTAIDFKNEIFANNLTNLYYDRYYNHPVAVIAQKQFERNNGTGRRGGGGRGGGGGFSFADLFSRFQNNGVYLYYLNVSGTVNNTNGTEGNVNVTSNVNITEDPATASFGIDSGFSKLVLDLWTTFADTGIPSGLPNNMTWTAVNGTAKPLQALNLVYQAPVAAAGSNQTEEGPQMVAFFEERMNFWDSFNLTDIYQ